MTGSVQTKIDIQYVDRPKLEALLTGQFGSSYSVYVSRRNLPSFVSAYSLCIHQEGEDFIEVTASRELTDVRRSIPSHSGHSEDIQQC